MVHSSWLTPSEVVPSYWPKPRQVVPCLWLATEKPLALSKRCRRADIILRCADGLSSSQVASELRVTNNTVCKWRSRYIEQGLAGLLDEPRSGAPRKVSDEAVEKVYAMLPDGGDEHALVLLEPA